MENSKIIITAALTGSMIGKTQNLSIPLTPKEIINDAVQCHKAGAAIVHVHVRNKDQKASLDFDIYKEVISGIRSLCDVLICISTSNYLVNISDDKRLKLFDLDIDLATLMPGAMVRNHEDYSNSKYFIKESLQIMNEKNIKPEMEIFSHEMFDNCKALFDIGLLGKNPFVQFILGSSGGMDKTYDNVQWMLDALQKDWFWSAAGIGKMQLPLNLISMLNGANAVRTGLEDNIFYTKDVSVVNNVQLVKRVADIAAFCGRSIATPQEARAILKGKEI